jgi:hypothetical protein
MWPIFLSQHTNWRRKDDIRHVENAQHDVVLVALEAEIFVHAVRLCVAQVAFIKSIEKIPEI